MVTFEGYERRIAQIEKCMKEYGFGSLEEVKQYTVDKGPRRGRYRARHPAHRF